LDKYPVEPNTFCQRNHGNESQERMGLVIGESMDILQRIADRERSPKYV
jgi:hypothetical protein